MDQQYFYIEDFLLHCPAHIGAVLAASGDYPEMRAVPDEEGLNKRAALKIDLRFFENPQAIILGQQNLEISKEQFLSYEKIDENEVKAQFPRDSLTGGFCPGPGCG